MGSGAHGRGWRGEERVAIALNNLGFHEGEDYWREFHLGPYFIDFAFPKECIAVEADGWVHTAATVRHDDKRRDAQLATWGWSTIRINVDSPARYFYAAIIKTFTAINEKRYPGQLSEAEWSVSARKKLADIEVLDPVLRKAWGIRLADAGSHGG